MVTQIPNFRKYILNTNVYFAAVYCFILTLLDLAQNDKTTPDPAM